MNYFDDLICKQVGGVISRVDGAFCTVADIWCVGLMLGDGFIRRRFPGGEDILRMPFLYLGRPQGSGAWGVVGNAQRENRWFILQGERAGRVVAALEEYQDETDRVIRLSNYRELIAIHQKALKLYQNLIPSKSYQLALCVEEFIGTVYDLLQVARLDSPSFHFAAKMAEMICNAPEGSYDFAYLAARHGISYQHFRRCFQEYTGLPVHEFLLEKRLSLAKRLLQEASLNVKECSDRCGFPRQAEFARFIKQRTGFTPSELRRQPQFDEG